MYTPLYINCTGDRTRDVRQHVLFLFTVTDKICTFELVQIHLYYSIYNWISLSHKSVLVVNTSCIVIVTQKRDKFISIGLVSDGYCTQYAS